VAHPIRSHLHTPLPELLHVFCKLSFQEGVPTKGCVKYIDAEGSSLVASRFHEAGRRGIQNTNRSLAQKLIKEHTEIATAFAAK